MTCGILLAAASGLKTFNRSPTKREVPIIDKKLAIINKDLEWEAKATYVWENRKLIINKKPTAKSPAARLKITVWITSRAFSGNFCSSWKNKLLSNDAFRCLQSIAPSKFVSWEVEP